MVIKPPIIGFSTLVLSPILAMGMVIPIMDILAVKLSGGPARTGMEVKRKNTAPNPITRFIPNFCFMTVPFFILSSMGDE
jgi:hypothetical protein